MKKYVPLALVLVLALVGAVLVPHPKPADAQSSDTWSGHNETTVSFNGNPGAGIATIATAVAGKQLTIKSMVITATTAGIVAIYDGTAGTSGTVLGTFYLAANVAQQIPEHMLGRGLVGTSGNALSVGEPGGTGLQIVYRLRAN